MARATFHKKGPSSKGLQITAGISSAPPVTGATSPPTSQSQFKTSTPKHSPGREAFASKSRPARKQDCYTVRAELRKKAPSAGNKRF